jgi:hypothetical protein
MENLAITLGQPCSSKNIHTLVGGGGWIGECAVWFQHRV